MSSNTRTQQLTLVRGCQKTDCRSIVKPAYGQVTHAAAEKRLAHLETSCTPNIPTVKFPQHTEPLPPSSLLTDCWLLQCTWKNEDSELSLQDKPRATVGSHHTDYFF